jgi:hypothetical protein
MNTKTYWIFLFLTSPTVSTVNPKNLRLTDPVILWYLPYCCVSFFGTKGRATLREFVDSSVFYTQ